MLKVTESREVTLNHNELITAMQRGDIPVGTTVKATFLNHDRCPAEMLIVDRNYSASKDIYPYKFGSFLPIVVRSATYTVREDVELPEPAPGVTYTHEQALLMFKHALWGGDWTCRFKATWNGGGGNRFSGSVKNNGFYEEGTKYTTDLINPNSRTVDPITVQSITLTGRIEKQVVRLNDVELLQALRAGTIPSGTTVKITHWNDEISTAYILNAACHLTSPKANEYKSVISSSTDHYEWGQGVRKCIDGIKYAEYEI